jgi:hypothetical protein
LSLSGARGDAPALSVKAGPSTGTSAWSVSAPRRSDAKID